MQFLLEKIENGDFLNHPKVIGEFIKYNLLEKERDHCKYFAYKFRHEDFTLKDIEKEYDATFNTKEMKTPIQKLIDKWEGLQKEAMGHLYPAISKIFIDDAKAMIEEEKRVIMDAFWNGGQWDPENISGAEGYYNETFHTTDK